MLLDILVVSFHDRNFVMSCVRVHELFCGLLMFFIRSRKWVAFSSGLISRADAAVQAGAAMAAPLFETSIKKKKILYS